MCNVDQLVVTMLAERGWSGEGSRSGEGSISTNVHRQQQWAQQLEQQRIFNAKRSKQWAPCNEQTELARSWHMQRGTCSQHMHMQHMQVQHPRMCRAPESWPRCCSMSSPS